MLPLPESRRKNIGIPYVIFVNFVLPDANDTLLTPSMNAPSGPIERVWKPLLEPYAAKLPDALLFSASDGKNP